MPALPFTPTARAARGGRAGFLPGSPGVTTPALAHRPEPRATLVHKCRMRLETLALR